MAIKLGSNISSLQAQRRLGEARSSLTKTYERLSSGQRINRAADDAAGLAIAKTLDARAKIFAQGIRNLNDGISYISIAEGALKELKTILYRQRELAAQASNGIYSDDQREALDNEFQSISSEWNRVLDSTTFNGRKVFSAKEGSLSLQGGVGIGAMLHAAFGSEEGAAQDDILMCTTSSDEVQGNAVSSERGSLSSDGRYLVFSSDASNLVAGDTNGVTDVFLKDLLTGETQRLSLSITGQQGNNQSLSPTISADGRYVAFTSIATNLVPADSNGNGDIFIKDLITGDLRRVSTNTQGQESMFGSSSAPSLSEDGRYVAFYSNASNLVSGDTNGAYDIFVKDTISGETTRVSTSSTGVQANSSSLELSISGDGRYVVFRSFASNLVAGDTNGVEDVFVKDRVTGETKLVSSDSDGTIGNGASGAPAISANGRYVAFHSAATNLVAGDMNGGYDVFLKDLLTGETRLLSIGLNGEQGNSLSLAPFLSADGRYAAFGSQASNLVPGDTNGVSDTFVRDLLSGEIKRLSVNSGGAEGTLASYTPAFSADGRYVAFRSDASNLVSGDGNGVTDQFVTGNPFVEWSSVSRNQWLNVRTQEQALIAQEKLDDYLVELNTVEGTLGAIGARVATAVKNLQSMTENFRAAETRISDADIGAEAAALMRNQIVEQAAASVLAQANQQPAITLKLLRQVSA